MFLTSNHKVHWYLKRRLAAVVDTDPFTIQLCFEPAGRGCTDDPFSVNQKINQCVCCGTKENLSKHHCVPFCFRRHFPDTVKNHNYHDVFPVCIDCHAEYEIHAFELKKEIWAEHGYKLDITVRVDRDLLRVKKSASALKLFRDKIPKSRQEELMDVLREFFKKSDIDEDSISAAAEMEFDNYWQKIAEKVDVQKFVVRWRTHFIETMKPKFMPEYWEIHRQAERQR